MPRSDSSLITGLSSASINKAERAKELREERARLKESKRTRIAPAIEPVIEELEKEKDRVILELLSMVTPTTPKDGAKELLVSLNLYKTSMERLKSRLSNIMREPSKKEVEND